MNDAYAMQCKCNYVSLTPRVLHLLPLNHQIPSGLHLFIITWLFSTIANISNRALVSTYISPITGNHPTSTGLSIAKHIFDPGPTL